LAEPKEELEISGLLLEMFLRIKNKNEMGKVGENFEGFSKVKNSVFSHLFTSKGD